MVSAKHYIIHGRVQGVGYRYFVLEAAERRKIRGYVRNLPGGAVEVQAEGQEEAMRLFKEDLQRGPRMAHVTKIIETDSQVSNTYSAFLIRG
jgi:acylphosphatase